MEGQLNIISYLDALLPENSLELHQKPFLPIMLNRPFTLRFPAGRNVIPVEFVAPLFGVSQ
jgi:hypothetical protein